ncbi:hypothetical protein VaNZ11_014111, partial [Volvox africanus]
MYGVVRRHGWFGIVAPSTLPDLSSAQSRFPGKQLIELSIHHTDQQSYSGLRPSALHAHLSGMPGRLPRAATPAPCNFGTKNPNLSLRSAFHRRAKRRKNVSSADDTDNPDMWLGYPPAVASQSSPGLGSLRGEGLGSLSSSTPSFESPLSPSTARALARGFREGELALASAGPLQVWHCGSRSGGLWKTRPPAQQNQRVHKAKSTGPPQSLQGPQWREPQAPVPHPWQPLRSPSAEPHPDALRHSAGHTKPSPPSSSATPMIQNPSLNAIEVCRLPSTASLLPSESLLGPSSDHVTPGAHAQLPGGDKNDEPASTIVTHAVGSGSLATPSAGADARASPGGGSGAVNDGDNIDVVLLGPAGRPRDLSVLVAAVERLASQPAGRGCIGCVVVSPSRERVDALHEVAFTLISERGGGPEAMHVMAVHGGTRFREDVSGLRSQSPDFLIATPGRLIDLLTTDEVELSPIFKSLRVLVLDGGEVLASRSFRPQMERLLRLLPNTALYTPPRRRGPDRLRPTAKTGTGEGAGAAQAQLAAPRAVTLLAAAGGIPHPTERRPPPSPPLQSPAAEFRGAAAAAARMYPGNPVLGQGRQPRVGWMTAGSGGAATQSGMLPHPELQSLIDLALRYGVAIFKLSSVGAGVGGEDGHWYDTAVSNSDLGPVRTLSATVIAALGSGNTQREGQDMDSDVMGQGVSHGSTNKAKSSSQVVAQPLDLTEREAASEAVPSTSSVLKSDPVFVDSPTPEKVAPPPLVPLHVLAVPYEEHLPYLYVIIRQHMLSEGSHKIVVQFPSAHLAKLYAHLFQALGFPAATAHSRMGQAARQEAVRDFAAGHRGLLFCTELAGLDAGCGLTMVLWVGLPHRPSQLVQHMATIQQAASVAAASTAAGAATGAAPGGLLGPMDAQGLHLQTAPVPTNACIPTAGAVPSTTGSASEMIATAVPGAQFPAVTAAHLPLQPARCLLLLSDVEKQRPVILAAAEAMAAAKLGRVLPVQPGGLSGPLDSVSRRIQQVLPKVSPSLKLRGLEGLLGHLWSSRSGAAASLSSCVAGAGLGPQPEEQLGIWARRFAAAMGMPQPPLLYRHVAARMGLRSIPGITLVDVHAGRPPLTGSQQLSAPHHRGSEHYYHQRSISWQQRRLQIQRQRQRQQQIQQTLRKAQKREQMQERQQKQDEERQRRKERQGQQQPRIERPKLHPPEVIGRFRWFRALKRTQKAQAQAQSHAEPPADVQERFREGERRRA